MNFSERGFRRSAPVLFLSQIISSICFGVARDIVTVDFSVFAGWIISDWVCKWGISLIIRRCGYLEYKKTVPFEDCFRSLREYIVFLQSKKTLIMSVSIPTWYCIIVAIHNFEYMDKHKKYKCYFFSTRDPFFSSIILYPWASRRSRIRSDSL